MADGQSGLQILDVSDSVNPALAGSFGSSGYRARGIFVQDNLAYVAVDNPWF